MLKLKKKYEGLVMSSGMVKKFNTNDITKETAKFYFDRGFKHIFNEVCDKCEKVKCDCTK